MVLGTGASGTLTFATTTDSVTNGLTNLTINSGTGNTITLGTPLHIYGVLSVNSGTFDVNHNHLTLHSNLTYGTAALGPVNDGGTHGTLSNADYVSVQRYHVDKRSWNMITAPLTMSGASSGNGSIATNWQLQTLITAPSQYTQYGLDLAPNNAYTMLNWTGSAWGHVTNTSAANTLIGNAGGTVADNKPFFMYIRGDRTVPATSGGTGHTSTILEATGALQTGDKSFNISSIATDGYALVANPYPAPISVAQLLSDNSALGTNSNTYIYYWDASTSATGGYTTLTYDGSGWISNSSNNSLYIQSGQAFFVTKTATATEVLFKEGQKNTSNGNSSNAVFGTSTTASIKIGLNKGTSFVDGVMTMYNNKYNAAVVAPTEDASKFWGNDENVAIVRTGSYLSVEARPEIAGADTSFLYMNKLTAGNTYTFNIAGNNMPTNVTGELVDKYTNISTPLNLTSPTSINFTVDTAAAAKAANRFMIVLNAKAPLYVSDIKVKASVKARVAVIDWRVATEKDVKSYTVEHSTTAADFKAINTTAAKNANNSNYSYTDNNAATGDNYYRIKAINVDGSIQYSSIAKVTIGDRKEGMSIYPNPIVGKTMNVQLSNIAAGTYSLSMINANGQQVMEQLLQHTGGSVTSTVQLPASVASGIYQLRLASNGKSYVETVIVK